MIKNIIFDVGQVLVDYRWRDYLAELGFSVETIGLFGWKGAVSGTRLGRAGSWCAS